MNRTVRISIVLVKNCIWSIVISANKDECTYIVHCTVSEEDHSNKIEKSASKSEYLYFSFRIWAAIRLRTIMLMLVYLAGKWFHFIALMWLPKLQLNLFGQFSQRFSCLLLIFNHNLNCCVNWFWHRNSNKR